MARDKKWNKDSKCGKYTIMSFVLKNSNCKVSSIPFVNSRVYVNVDELCLQAYLNKDDNGYLTVTKKGIKEFIRQKHLTE